MAKFISLVASALVLITANAHPGEQHDASSLEAGFALHKRHAAHIARGLDRCASHPAYTQLQARGVQRREAKAQHLRAVRGLEQSAPYKTRRDSPALDAFALLNHNETSSNTTVFTAPSSLFASFSNVSCILTPEVTQGPYYVSGEYVRSNIIESEEGVPVYIEYQYIDVNTCGPASHLHVEMWSANATGVYSGIISKGNGNTDDTSNLNKTALRGLQPTDYEGVTSFETLFPGHYVPRVNHMHVIAHHKGRVYKNGTFHGGSVSHVGQIFFPEELTLDVEATYPYNTNTQAMTNVTDDSVAQGQADNNYDPFVSFAYLGDSVTDGLLMWISIGIDLSANYTVSAAATYTADGGVLSGSSSGSGGSGSNGTMPSGSGAPSGGMPSGSGAPSGGMPSGTGTASGGRPSGTGTPSGGMPSGTGTASGGRPSGTTTSSATNSASASA